jgi:hypothetical protein
MKIILIKTYFHIKKIISLFYFYHYVLDKVIFQGVLLIHVQKRIYNDHIPFF